MLQLKVNGEWVDLGANPVITLDEESPVFEKTSIPGGYSFPFTLPATSRNRRIFGFPERIEKRAAMAVSLDFELFHSGKLRLSGTITVSEADTEYRANLVSGSGNLASQISGKKLKDLTYGGVRSWVNKAEFTEDDDYAVFPVYNPDFLSGLSGYNWAANDYRLNSYDPSTEQWDDTGTFAISPFPFLSYVLKRIFNSHGFAIKEDIVSADPELRKLVLYTNYDASVLTTTTRQVWVQIGIDPINREPIEELVDVVETERTMDTFNLVDCMPDVTIADFLIWLRNRLNLAFLIDHDNNVRIIRRDQLIETTAFTDITAKAAGDPRVVSVDQKDGFILEWIHDENDANFAEEVFRNIEDYPGQFKGSVANSGELVALTPEINDIYYVETLDEYYQFMYVEDVGDGSPGYMWQRWSINFQNYTSGEKEEEFSSEISTTRMINFQRVITGGTIRCPWVLQPSNGKERTEYQPFSVRLLLYQGRQPDSNSDMVPMGSSDNLDLEGNRISGANLSLHWNGTYGVYNQLWKNYLTWWMTRRQVNYKITDPSTLEFNRKYAIDGKHYLLKKRTVTFTLRSVAVGECEFYLV